MSGSLRMYLSNHERHALVLRQAQDERLGRTDLAGRSAQDTSDLTPRFGFGTRVGGGDNASASVEPSTGRP